MRRFGTRLALVALAVAAFALVGAGPAWAHAALVATDPADHAALDHGPASVTATFDDRLQTSFGAMTVVGPDGNLWSTGTVRIDGVTAATNVRPLGPVGTYTVNYRVTSADGHVVSGAWSFDLTVAGRGTPGPPVAAAGSEDGALPVWPFVVAALVIVGAAGWWAARRRP